MSLPDFDDGLLPPGRHRGTVDEVREALVAAFPQSTTRAAIYSFWQDRRAAVAEHVDAVGEWLDGSFTTDKRDPADIDLVTIIDGPSFDEAPRHRRQVVASLVAGTTTEEFWSCDANVVVHYPADDLASSRTAVAAGCWAAYFGHTRDGTSCGIVELVEDGREGIEVADEDASLHGSARDAEAQLQAHLDRFDRALQAFDDPDATDRPGLRLMGETLRRKRDELQGKLRDSRRVEVEVAPSSGEPAAAGAMAAVVTTLVGGVTQVAQAMGPGLGDVDPAAVSLALAVRLVGGEDGDGAVLLRAADRDARQAVPAPTGHESLVVAVLHAILDAVPPGAHTGAAADAAGALREAVAAHALPLTLTLRWPFGLTRRVELPTA